MGVYIKDMDMPKNCLNCPFSEYGTVDEFKYYCRLTNVFVGMWSDKKLSGERHRKCPLEEMTEE